MSGTFGLKQFTAACLVALLLIASGLASALPLAALYAQTPTATYTAAPAPYPIRVGIFQIEGELVECGTVTFPENDDQPSGGQLQLTYVVTRPSSPSLPSLRCSIWKALLTTVRWPLMPFTSWFLHHCVQRATPSCSICVARNISRL